MNDRAAMGRWGNGSTGAFYVRANRPRVFDFWDHSADVGNLHEQQGRVAVGDGTTLDVGGSPRPALGLQRVTQLPKSYRNKSTPGDIKGDTIKRAAFFLFSNLY